MIDPDALDKILANRGDCAGPLTTFPDPDVAHVAIVCRDNWVEVIEWLAACEKSMPELLRVYRAALAWERAQRSAHRDPRLALVEADQAMLAALDATRSKP